MPDGVVAKVRATALAWVIQTITDEAGAAIAAQLPAPEIAHRARAAAATVLDDIDADRASR